MNLSAFFKGFQEVALDLEALGVDTEPIVAAINPGAGAVEGTVLGIISIAQKLGSLFAAQAAANAAAATPAAAVAAPAAPAAPVVAVQAAPLGPAPADLAPVDESQVLKPGPGLQPVVVG